MPKSLLDYVVGDLGEKRAYRRFVKRVNALPKDYRCAFKKIRRYMFNFGGDGCRMEILTDLAELFESSAAEGKPVADVIGCDAAGFCEELIRAAGTNPTPRDKLNGEIYQYFHREGDGDA